MAEENLPTPPAVGEEEAPAAGQEEEPVAGQEQEVRVEGDEEEEEDAVFADGTEEAVELDDEPPPSDDDDDDDDEEEEEEEGGEDKEDDDEDGQGQDERKEDGADEENDAALEFAGHSDSVYAVALHPTEPLAATGGGDDRGFLWNTSSGEPVAELQGHTDSVAAVAFSADGSLLATGGLDGAVRLWDARTGVFDKALEGPSEDVEWLSWHSGGNVLLAGSADATVWMWLAATGACMQVFASESASTCGCFSGDGKLVVAGYADGAVRLWGPKLGTVRHTFQGAGWHDAGITSLAAHPTQAMGLCGSQDGSARLFTVAGAGSRVVGALNHSGLVADELNQEAQSVESVGFSPAHRWCATAGLDGALRTWDVSTLQSRETCQHDEAIVKLRWHATEPLVFTTSVDGQLRLWDVRSAEMVRSWRGHSDMAVDLAARFGPASEDDVVVSVGDDHRALVFRPSSS